WAYREFARTLCYGQTRVHPPPTKNQLHLLLVGFHQFYRCFCVGLVVGEIFHFPPYRSKLPTGCRPHRRLYRLQAENPIAGNYGPRTNAAITIKPLPGEWSKQKVREMRGVGKIQSAGSAAATHGEEEKRAGCKPEELLCLTHLQLFHNVAPAVSSKPGSPRPRSEPRCPTSDAWPFQVGFPRKRLVPPSEWPESTVPAWR